MSKLLRLEPIFREKIWGGDRMRDMFGYRLPGDRIGECWAVSGHPNGDCAIRNPELAGETLGSLWRKRPELFGNLPGEIFPLMVKIIDAREDLSIQVHPGDEYARTHEGGALGKSECWYILDCPPRAEVVFGHNAKTREEMGRLVSENRWGELLGRMLIKKGDFIEVEPGCIHALMAGTVVLETQQSSDVTYRLYDYGRLQDGKPRPLHIERSLEVARIPHTYTPSAPVTWTLGDAEITRLTACRCFSVYRMELHGKAETVWSQSFVNISVLRGRGRLGDTPVAAGDHLVITAQFGPMELEGDMELIYSHLTNYIDPTK